MLPLVQLELLELVALSARIGTFLPEFGKIRATRRVTLWRAVAQGWSAHPARQYGRANGAPAVASGRG
ncbi:MAG TPA: hypothetical protein VIX19_02425 [Terriglobales bacterium]